MESCFPQHVLEALDHTRPAARFHVEPGPPADGHGAERRELAATAWRAIRHSLNRNDGGGTSLEEETQDFSLAAR